MLCLHAACRSRYFVRHLLCMNAKSGHQTSDFRTSDIERRSRTGDPCFAIVTQYESYKVTVFVWGKRKHSAVSCCCLQCSQEVSWWYAQILLPYKKTKTRQKKDKVGGKRWTLSRHRSLSNTTFSMKFELRQKINTLGLWKKDCPRYGHQWSFPS